MLIALLRPLLGLIITLISFYLWPSIRSLFSITALSLSDLSISRFLLVLTYLFSYSITNKLVNRYLWDGVVQSRSGRPVPALLKTISSILLLFICATFIFTLVFDRSLTGVLAVGGGMSLIIGIALQNMIADFFSGLAINIDQPF